MSEDADEFTALLARARGGDRDALAELAREYEAKVRVVARVLLGPALRPYLDSLDLVQSVHRTVLLGLREDKFDVSTPERLLSLALTLVRRKVARQWRYAQRQQRFDRRPDTSESLVDFLTSLCSPAEDPAEAAEQHDQMERMCANLTDADRRLLELRGQGYNTDELAQELGLSDVAVRVRLTRLRQRLAAAGILEEVL